ncbi:uncharacterized protein LOC116124544 [Pistacia vera]|uniref:uncharacterized protein LOC116124544 n=1 Tax=Pistacia vera TaxID=55513 RepID=UPI001262CB09|nr:uncharacterized protein LOC116124544 [Pistacia vera]
MTKGLNKSKFEEFDSNLEFQHEYQEGVLINDICGKLRKLVTFCNTGAAYSGGKNRCSVASKCLVYAENISWFSGLSSLKHLDLSDVDLRKVSDWLLVMNTLPFYELPHFPQLSLANFSSLTTLGLSDNEVQFQMDFKI